MLKKLTLERVSTTINHRLTISSIIDQYHINRLTEKADESSCYFKEKIRLEEKGIEFIYIIHGGNILGDKKDIDHKTDQADNYSFDLCTLSNTNFFYLSSISFK
jgi:hypothetical protein